MIPSVNVAAQAGQGNSAPQTPPPPLQNLAVDDVAEAKSTSWSVPYASNGAPPQYPIESVDNALKILLLLGEIPEVRLTDVGRHLGVATSTAHRILAMLQWRGFVRRLPNNKSYGPGPALMSIAFSSLRRMDVPRIVGPILEALSAKLGETVHLGSIEGSITHFLAVSESTSAVRVASRVGKELPAHCTSTGKILLSNLSQEQLHHIYPNDGLVRVTAHSPSTRAELERDLEKARSSGYATSREESEEGVASVAVAVPARGNSPQFAINVSAPVHRLPLSRVKDFATELHHAAGKVAELLG